MKAFDIIGDIHGCSQTLEKLLEKLGYRPDPSGIFRHAKRSAIFLGDFIDRGPFQREVISIVRPMIDSGSAKSVMGNHEYNAIAYATADEANGGFLREHSVKNLKQHQQFLNAYADSSQDYAEIIDWFKSLPLWLDLDEIRIIHACWDKEMISKIASPMLTDQLLHSSSNKSLWQYQAIETILKGKEITLPDGGVYHDKDGNPRHNIRVRWWDQSANTYSKAFMGPESARTHIPDDEIIGDHLIEYSHDQPPVFLGHYWLEGPPVPLAANIACTDYSIAKPGGKLVAYRWDGEKKLLKEKFASVNRVENA